MSSDIYYEQTILRSRLLDIYSKIPKTGLYDVNLDPRKQVTIFLRYLRFLHKQLYNGPRNTELRRLTELAKNAKIDRTDDYVKLYALLDLNPDEVTFDVVLKRYQEKSNSKNAGKKYSTMCRMLDTIEHNQMTTEKLEKIKTELEKKYPPEEVNNKLIEIVDESEMQTMQIKKSIDKMKSDLHTDENYQHWKDVIGCWYRLGYSELEKSYRDLDKGSGEHRSNNGLNLVDTCESYVIETVAGRCNIKKEDLKVIREIYTYGLKDPTAPQKMKYASGEIDMILLDCSKGEIVAVVEVKAGIYDIPYAIEQINRTQKFFNDIQNLSDKLGRIIPLSYYLRTKSETKITTNIRCSSDMIYLVVTTLPIHTPSTGASFSDVQLMSKLLYDKYDSFIRSIIDKDTELTDNEIQRVYMIMADIRSKLKYNISPEEAVTLLGKNLLIIP